MKKDKSYNGILYRINYDYTIPKTELNIKTLIDLWKKK